MALKLTPPLSLPIFVPKSPSPRTPSELRFSRWNNANAQKFIRRERAQKEIEDEIRRERRYQSASIIADNDNNSKNNPELQRHVPITTNETFKSIGTPSSPSRPSIPGKRSKYSKQTLRRTTRRNTNFTTHPAFTPNDGVNVSIEDGARGGITVGERGIAYRIPNAPFEFQYSYTETPKVKPLGLREAPYLPFGPATMPRPWTGRAPHPPSKKRLPEFDSFKLPPADKKGVKPVQAPGPFLEGMGPKYAVSREEILGAPLTAEETKELVRGCLRTRRQLNMGRDGLTHNMLDNIHAHWKRRRVCKIKCKGVCTVDLDNVCQQLEEKTEGKIIYKRGGVLFLFRGRNYNYKTRPKYPLMLWKPITPVYPRLVRQAPEGLTIEEAREMRKRGHKLPPICKLGKNGVYSDLVKLVREAFEECELVRINCQGMNGSDYRKIGAKLKDLVPCVLISFAFEHILIWRGRDWKSSFPKSENGFAEVKESEIDGPIDKPPSFTDSSVLQDQETSASRHLEDAEDVSDLPNEEDQKSNFLSALSDTLQSNNLSDDDLSASGSQETSALCDEISTTTVIAPSSISGHEDSRSEGTSDGGESPAVVNVDSNTIRVHESLALITSYASNVTNMEKYSSILDRTEHLNDDTGVVSIDSDHSLYLGPKSDGIITLEQDTQLATSASSTCTEAITLLLQEAIENGSAVILDDTSLDDNIIYDAAVSLAKAAPPGPVFRHQRQLCKASLQNENGGKQEDRNLEEVARVPERKFEKSSSRSRRVKDFKGVCPDSSPQGSLGVDELAKLLA